MGIAFSKTTRRNPAVDLGSEAVSLEYKSVSTMTRGPLRHLDGTTIQVEFAVGGSIRSVVGRATYDSSDPDFGNVLKIVVADPVGDFEFVVPESNWTGNAEPSDLPGCDYRISLE